MEKYWERVILESLNLICYWKKKLMRCINSKHKSCGIDEDLPCDPYRVYHCMPSCWGQEKAPHTKALWFKICYWSALKLLHKRHVKEVHTSTPKCGCWHLPDTQDMAGTTHRQIHTRTCHKSPESVTAASQGRTNLPQAHSKQVYSKWLATVAEHCSKHAWNG